MRLLDRLVAWAIFSVGVVHCLYTFRLYKELSSAALWFFSGGLLLIYLAGFNLLRVRYASVAPGSRLVCLGANLAALAFAVVYATRQGAAVLRDPPSVALLVLLAVATAFSSARPYPANRAEAGAS